MDGRRPAPKTIFVRPPVTDDPDSTRTIIPSWGAGPGTCCGKRTGRAASPASSGVTGSFSRPSRSRRSSPRCAADGTLVGTVEVGSFGSWYCQGVAIDLSARVFRCHPCWAKGRHVESLDQRIRTSPGWDIRRMGHGMAEHLAVTGRHAPDLLSPPSDDCSAAWDSSRHNLRPDPRPLRTPHIRGAG